MSRDKAKKWYDPGVGDPVTEYISPDDAKHSVNQIYADMGDVVQFGNGVNGITGHLYTPDPYFADVDVATFVGLNPVGWIDRGLVVADTEAISDHGALSGLGDDDHPQYLTTARGDARYPSRAEMQVIDDDLGTLEESFDTHEGAADPHMQYQKESEKGQANGYAPLDAQGLLPVAHVPPLTVNDVFTVASEAEMLALVAERGDMAIRTDNNTTMVLAAEPASVLANWKAVTAAGQVLSVNGQTGAVTLDAEDVGADATGTAAAAVAAHVAAGDPHPQYLTAPEAPQPATTTPGQADTTAGQVGTSELYAREDHRHQVPTATPVGLGSVAAPGVGSSLSRADHVHPYPSATNVGADPIGTASAAISAHNVAADPHAPYYNQARGDARYSQLGHVHADAGHVIQDEGTPLTNRVNLNFVGTGVTVTDDGGNNRTNVTINTAAPGVTDHGALTGLGDDDHPQYVKDTGDTITGKVTVENGTVAEPGLVMNRTVVSSSEGDAAILEAQYLGQRQTWIGPKGELRTAKPVEIQDWTGTDKSTIEQASSGNLIISPQNATEFVGSVLVPTPTLDGQATNKGYVDGEITEHEAAGDPHPQYLTSAEAPQPGSSTPEQADAASGAAGIAPHYARADHRHQVPVGSPVALGMANNIGTSASLARADHVHAYPTAAEVGAADAVHAHDQYLTPSEILAGTNVTVDLVTTPGSAIINASGGGAGVSDHGALTGLADDDHPQYAKKVSVLKTIIDYGADPTGVASSDAAFAAFMADTTTAAVRVPAGNYKITAPIVMQSGKQMIGDHAARDSGETTLASVITQANNVEIITGVDIRGVTLENLALAVANKATHTADGISFTRSANPATNYVTLKDVHVFGPGRDGIAMSNLIVSAWSGVTVVNSGRHGFNLYGVESGAAGTSVSMDACYANTCGAKETGHGFRIRKMTYLSLTGCASEGNTGSAYHITQSQGISLAGCGAEAPFGPSSFYVGDLSIGVTLNACWTYGNNGVAFDVDGSGTVAALVGCTEMDPVGATASFRTGAGTNVTLINPFGYTAKVLDASTVVLANVAGQIESNIGKFGTAQGNSVVAKPASGIALMVVDRPATNVAGQIEFRTAGATTNGWAFTHLATTNNLRLWNFNGGKNALVLDSAGTYMDVVSKRIINVAEPTAATDAATKDYVDTTYATGVGVLTLDAGAPVPGGTPSGTLIFRRPA